ALHSYALAGHGPGHTLELVDRFVHSLGDGAMATAVYATLDTTTGTLRFASAGHLPPIVFGGGEARVVEVPPAPPLGAFPYGPCPEHGLILERGETIVLYTDGLVERPRIPLNDGIDRLREIVRHADSVEDACVLAVDRLVPPEG